MQSPELQLKIKALMSSSVTKLHLRSTCPKLKARRFCQIQGSVSCLMSIHPLDIFGLLAKLHLLMLVCNSGSLLTLRVLARWSNCLFGLQGAILAEVFRRRFGCLEAQVKQRHKSTPIYPRQGANNLHERSRCLQYGDVCTNQAGPQSNKN